MHDRHILARTTIERNKPDAQLMNDEATPS